MVQTSYELKSPIDKLIEVQIHGIHKTWVEIHLTMDTLFNLLKVYGSHCSHELRFLFLRRMHLHEYCACKSMNFVPIYLNVVIIIFDTILYLYHLYSKEGVASI